MPLGTCLLYPGDVQPLFFAGRDLDIVMMYAGEWLRGFWWCIWLITSLTFHHSAVLVVFRLVKFSENLPLRTGYVILIHLRVKKIYQQSMLDNCTWTYMRAFTNYIIILKSKLWIYLPIIHKLVNMWIINMNSLADHTYPESFHNECTEAAKF